MAIKFEGAQVILDDDTVETDILVDDGIIVDVGTSLKGHHVIDGRGLLLAPAMVDIHGDAFERQVMPRPNVFFPIDAALLETDRQLATNGIATAYHALTLSWEPGLRSVARGEEISDTLKALGSRLTIENRLQLRWETFAFEAIDFIERALGSALTPSIAFNDHTSMSMRDRSIAVQDRLFEHNPGFRTADIDEPAFMAKQASNARRAGLSPTDYVEKLRSVWERRTDVQAAIARVAKVGRSKSVPMLSHDDSQDETRRYYRGLGAAITEFPMSISVAEAARNAGDVIVFGAPNVVRGGSHIGSPSAADMVEAGLCDALASDYFYPAMLAAVARIFAEKRASLHEAWRLVSKGPAHALNLSDRGQIAPGKRADLLLVDWPDHGTPAVKLTMSKGRIAYMAGNSGFGLHTAT